MDDDESSLGITLRSIAGVLGCQIQATKDPHAYFEDFESRYCFNASAQPALTAEQLTDFVADLPPGVVQEMEEPLGAFVTVLWRDDDLIVVGPYTTRTTLESEDAEVLRALRLHRPALASYRLWRAKLPIVDSEYVMRSATVLAGDPSQSEISEYRRIRVQAGGSKLAMEPSQNSAPFHAINERYAAEHAFMQAVARGDETAALSHLGQIKSKPIGFGYLSIPYLAPTILRTLCRVAAQQGGLAPAAIEAVSQTYAQRLHRVGLTPGVQGPTADAVQMVRTFCQLVQRQHRLPYSPLVRKAVGALLADLQHSPSPAALADELVVPLIKLRRSFKAETGLTMSQFVAHERVSIAARLLIETDQPVNQIAGRVGYGDANYFVKVFRSITGATPSDYRKQKAQPAKREDLHGSSVVR